MLKSFMKSANSLADEKDVDLAEVKLVEVGKCGESIVGGMLAGVKLCISKISL